MGKREGLWTGRLKSESVVYVSTIVTGFHFKYVI